MAERAARTLMLTHTDLDGVGAAVLLCGARPGRATFKLVENGEIDAEIREAIAVELARPHRDRQAILVVDHGMSHDTAELVQAFVEAGGRFHLLDHHRSAAHLAPRSWVTVDEARSGTGLLFDHLGRPAAYADFAALVEDHDLWRHADERSARLAALAGLLGHERFIRRFTGDPRVHFTDAEDLILETEATRREDYIRRKIEQARLVAGDGATWAVCYAEQYQSDLAERLMVQLGVDATAVVNAGKRTVSLRSRGPDVSALAQRFGGGGHARAAAFSFRKSSLETPLVDFETALAGSLVHAPGLPDGSHPS